MDMSQLVGILNVTPDSFSDGGKFFSPERAINQAKKLFTDGAAIVDVGAESTKPNAIPLTADEEWERLEPVLRVLVTLYPNKISVDSYHPENIKRSFDIGPVIVNDVTGMNNPDMVRVVSELQPTVIISHLPTQDIQEAHRLIPISSVKQVKLDLLAKAKLLEDKGLKQSQIILDPGIGFGKTPMVNRELLGFAKEVPQFRVMIGYSRKRFLGDNRMDLEPNLEAGKIAVGSGAAYLRVHDVSGHESLMAE
jgi:dihydropteroate synthase